MVKQIKYFLIGFLILSSLFITCSFKQCDSAPEINKEIISFVEASIGKKIGRGECWDLAAEALNKVGAKWDGKQNFGKEVDYLKACVFPGDVVQFERVMLQYEKDKKFYVEKLQHHTAIIYEVKEKGNFVIADQNTRFSGKKVGTHSFEVKDVTKGKFKIFRPYK